jgi:hypothetical protein
MLGAVELIGWPDAEEAVVQFLTEARELLAALDGFRFGTQVRTGDHVQVIRTGGVRGLIRDDAQITIDVRSSDAARAARAADAVSTLLTAAGRAGEMGVHTIYEVSEFAALRWNPDPDNPTVERYSATYTVPFRGTTEGSQ